MAVYPKMIQNSVESFHPGFSIDNPICVEQGKVAQSKEGVSYDLGGDQKGDIRCSNGDMRS